MASSHSSISAQIPLTGEQKSALAKTFGIDVKHVPDQIGVVGMPQSSIRTLGIPDTMKAKFSPALMML
jgi:hypothetical protein